MKNIFSVMLAILLGTMGCAHQEISERSKKIESIFLTSGFDKLDIKTHSFTLRAWQSQPKQSNQMHVYIEGDGFSWVTRTQPSRNPTPIYSIVPELAVQDTEVNSVYLARPCQYVSLELRSCDKAYWTNSRFSKEVVDSMNDAISQLKIAAKVKDLVLIGYSGGGALAVLIAAQRNDVISIVTIAGNLDHKAWTKHHHLSTLDRSLNPPDYWQSVILVPQIHFVGGVDKIVPVDIYKSYREKFPENANIHMEILSGFDHKCCWVKNWNQLLGKVQ